MTDSVLLMLSFIWFSIKSHFFPSIVMQASCDIQLVINSLSSLNNIIKGLDMRGWRNGLLCINNISSNIVHITFRNDVCWTNYSIFWNNMISGFNIRISYFLLHRDYRSAGSDYRLNRVDNGWNRRN